MESRQVRKQHELRTAGKCILCGRDRGANLSTCRCSECLARTRELARRRTGFHAWQRGKVGRPPLEARKAPSHTAALDAIREAERYARHGDAVTSPAGEFS
jgi:hypothetical protein